MERELIIRVDGRGSDGDAGSVLVYWSTDGVSLVATAEKNGDAEVILDRGGVAALAKALSELMKASDNHGTSADAGIRHPLQIGHQPAPRG